MSNDEMDLAMGKLITRYHDLKKRHALIESNIVAWEDTFGRLSATIRQFQIADVPSGLLTYPNPQTLKDTLEEWRQVAKAMQEARRQMQDAGVNLA